MKKCSSFSNSSMTDIQTLFDMNIFGKLASLLLPDNRFQSKHPKMPRMMDFSNNQQSITHRGIMEMKKAFIVAALLASLPMSSYAEASFGDNQSIGAKISTLGLGLDYSFTIAESFEGRVGFNVLKHHLSKTADNVDYKGDIKLGTVDMLVDWFPANDSLRFTAGLMFNNNKLTLTGVDKLGVTEYATGDFRKVSPYLGIGWTGKKKDQGLQLSADLGVLFQGKPRTTVTAPDVDIASLNYNYALMAANPAKGLDPKITGETALNTYLASHSQSLADALKNFKLYPVVSLTASYMF